MKNDVTRLERRDLIFGRILLCIGLEIRRKANVQLQDAIFYNSAFQEKTFTLEERSSSNEVDLIRSVTDILDISIVCNFVFI